MSHEREYYEPIPYGPPVEPVPVIRPKGKHGGRRPGAGAPRGNLNSLKHGRNSRYHQKLLATLITVPEVAEALVRLAERRRKQQRKTEAAAAEALADLFQRAGQIVLAPENNQLQNNQELLRFLRAAESSLREALAEQSSEHPQSRKQSSRGAARHAPTTLELDEQA